MDKIVNFGAYMRWWMRFISLCVISILLSGCAGNLQKPATTTPIDPFQSFNRTMFKFNIKVLDRYILRPTAVFWISYIPAPVRNGTSNFLSNLNEPSNVVNSLLEGHPKKALLHFTRFFLNTVFGLGGLIDVASMANPDLQKMPNITFGSVLGYYGVGYGPYFVLPGYGSATITKDLFSLVDYLYPPLSLFNFWTNVGRWALNGIATRAEYLNQESLLFNAQDPYIFSRSAYFQYQNFLNSNGQPKVEQNHNEHAIQADLQSIDTP